jgi:glycosyltransferase involved in cell wall biosynthesis
MRNDGGLLVGMYAERVAAQSHDPINKLRLMLWHSFRRLARPIAYRIPSLYRLYLSVKGINAAKREANDPQPSVPENLQLFFESRRQQRRRLLRSREDLRIVQIIGSLSAGGAERQLCNFVRGAAERGWAMQVMTTNPLVEDHAHYLELLHQIGVFPTTAGTRFDPRFKAATRDCHEVIEIAAQLPNFFMPWTLDLLGEFLLDPPDILHAWLDHTNVWGGVAALLADVPVIILSTRNVNPNHFAFAHPLFKPWYQLLAASPSVHFINNSQAGATDYADWLGLPPERFHVVRNGIDPSSVVRPQASDIEAFRQEIQIPPEASLVAGVFRLSKEKQPSIFVEVVRCAMLQHPHLYAVIAGVGPYEADLRKAIAASGCAKRFHVLGPRQDVPVIISAADVFLLTSSKEGTPNVLLEAQWLGCPVVATKAGGAVDAVSHEHTGLLVEVGDVEGLTAALLTLLNDKTKNDCYSDRGPKFIEAHFGLDRMVDETLRVYEFALSRVVTA